MPYELPTDYAVLASVGVGIYSLFARRNRQTRSSWPTWLVVPLLLLLSVVLGFETIPPTPEQLRVFYFAVIAIVLVRWVVALARRERSRRWIIYILMVVAVTCLIEALRVTFSK